MPVFADGRIIAWTANIAHNSDVGGMAPGSLTGEATEIFQEGLRLPAIKIISKGETDPLGDGHHQGQFAHARRARRRRLGGDRLGAHRRQAPCRARREIWRRDLRERDVVASWISASRCRSPSWPSCRKGTFELSEEQDDGRIFNVKITISDTEFVVDLRDNPDQSTNPVNTSRDGVDGLRADDLQVADRPLFAGQ